MIGQTLSHYRIVRKGLELWTTGADEHDVPLVVSLLAEPGYDPLRSHAAYHALLRKMNREP